MEYVNTCHINDVGDFEYYISKTDYETDNGTVSTYGIAVKNVFSGQMEEVADIWHDKNKVLDFINILCKNQVTLIHLKEICEEFTEELYSIYN